MIAGWTELDSEAFVASLPAYSKNFDALIEFVFGQKTETAWRHF